MDIKIQYETGADRERILAENANLTLKEEQNIAEGNFLILTDEKPLSLEIAEIKYAIADTNAMLLEFMEASLG